MQQSEWFYASSEGKALLEHAKWVTERYEKMNDQLLKLSSPFLGFLGVEIALLAQINMSEYEDKPWIIAVGILALILLLAAVCCFFWVLVSIRFQIPLLADFQNVIGSGKTHVARYPFELMFRNDQNIPNIQESFEKENEYLNRFYSPGLWLGLLAQIVVVVLVGLIWIF